MHRTSASAWRRRPASVPATAAPGHARRTAESSCGAPLALDLRELSVRLRGLGRSDSVIVILKELRNRGSRHIEYRLWHDAEQNGQHDQRREDHRLAPADVTDTFERRLEIAENHLSVEPQRVSSRQDNAKRGKRGDRYID